MGKGRLHQDARGAVPSLAWQERYVVGYLCDWAALVAGVCLSSGGLSLSFLVVFPLAFTLSLPLAMLCFFPLALAGGVAFLAWEWACFLAGLLPRRGSLRHAPPPPPACPMSHRAFPPSPCSGEPRKR